MNMQKIHRTNSTGLSGYFLALCLLVLGTGASAQNNPLLNQYFNNTYLANPAMAGEKIGAAVDLAFRSQWGSVPGGPVVQNLTATYGWERIGLGLNLSLDKAGLQRQTRVLATYAYHLPLTDNTKLHFGLSAGFMNQRIETQDLVGNPNDNQVGMYNDRKTYFDGDFGLGLTSSGLSADVALVNLKNYFKRDDFKLANTPVLYASAGYAFNLNDNILQPKVAYRSFTEIDDVVDMGAQFGIANQQVLFTAMYHTSRAASFGLGLHFRKKYSINTSYTTQTAALSSYTNGSFEVNLGIKW